MALIPPLIIALIVGLWHGRKYPGDRREFAISLAWAVAWAFVITYIWQATWVSAALPAPWHDTVISAFNLTLWTAAFWLPVLVITFIIRAMIARPK